jgi:hypothetical protein
MEEAVLIKEAVKHASVNFLFFLDFRAPESLHGLNQLGDFLVDITRLG